MQNFMIDTSLPLYKRRRLSISCSICVLSSIGTSLPIAVLDHSFDLHRGIRVHILLLFLTAKQLRNKINNLLHTIL
jgi:hypothetical protein